MQSINTQRILAGLSGLCLMFAACTAWAHCTAPGGKHGSGHPHCVGGGQEDPVFTAESDDPYISQPLVSFSLDGEDTIVFRNAQVDFSNFGGTWAGGGPCDHGVRTGTFTLHPKSNQLPDIAVMTSTFLAELENNGDTVMHFFTMEGEFDGTGNWPPSDGFPVEIKFNSWEIRAENKKAQRKDCAGAGDAVDPNKPWTVTVTRQ